MVHILHHLLKREVSTDYSAGIQWKETSFEFKLSHFSKNVVIRGPEDYPDMKSVHQIKEVHAMGNLILTLSSTGIGILYRRHSGDLVAKLNTADQVIQTVFYNKYSNSLAIVFVTRYDNFASLRCQASNLKLHWKTLFRTEVLKHPGFIEFDEHSKTVITLCAVSRVFKIWDLDTNELLYATPKHANQIFLSFNLLLLANSNSPNMPLQIVSYKTNEQITSHCVYPLEKNVDIIELFGDKLLVKPEGARLQIWNIITGNKLDVHGTKHIPPRRFIPLTERNMFLAVVSEGIVAWNLDGFIIFSTPLKHCLSSSSKIFVTSAQNVMIITIRGTMYGLNLHTGECTTILLNCHVTAVAYDEDCNELYCGHEGGDTSIWC